MTREGGADSTVCKIPFWDIRRNRENSTYHVAFSLTNSSAILHQLSSATHNTSMNFNNIEFLETSISFLFTEFIKDDRRRRFNGKIFAFSLGGDSQLLLAGYSFTSKIGYTFAFRNGRISTDEKDKNNSSPLITRWFARDLEQSKY